MRVVSVPEGKAQADAKVCEETVMQGNIGLLKTF